MALLANVDIDKVTQNAQSLVQAAAAPLVHHNVMSPIFHVVAMTTAALRIRRVEAQPVAGLSLWVPLVANHILLLVEHVVCLLENCLNFGVSHPIAAFECVSNDALQQKRHGVAFLPYIKLIKGEYILFAKNQYQKLKNLPLIYKK